MKKRKGNGSGGMKVFPVGEKWNPMQAKLRELLAKGEPFAEAMALLEKMHAILHTQKVYGGAAPTLMDAVWENMTDRAFATMPTKKDVTVAWNIWHITRIEDLTANLLIAGGSQVLDRAWQERLCTGVLDTGNAMTDAEILSFSRQTDREALRDYRDAVGRRTREIIAAIAPLDLKRKVNKQQVDRILQEGGVLPHAESVWLLDFWGRKNVAGILLMPITRHQMGHLNDCLKLKERIGKMDPAAEGVSG